MGKTHAQKALNSSPVTGASTGLATSPCPAAPRPFQARVSPSLHNLHTELPPAHLRTESAREHPGSPRSARRPATAGPGSRMAGAGRGPARTAQPPPRGHRSSGAGAGGRSTGGSCSRTACVLSPVSPRAQKPAAGAFDWSVSDGWVRGAVPRLVMRHLRGQRSRAWAQ